jgi:hypothetical protein
MDLGWSIRLNSKDTSPSMSFSKKTFFYLICVAFLHLFCERAIAKLEANKVNLPKSVGNWTRTDTPREINSENIFAYMNGAGELYLAYRFQHLDVFEYTSDNQNNILVELYYMETSDDAFGLLSLDWGGEPVFYEESAANTSNQPPAAPPLRALYGAGLLRIWSDNIYARVLANRETLASKQTVLTLGRLIAANRKRPPEPELFRRPLKRIGSAWELRKDRMSFFRSYLVLNSIYYLSDKDILDLDLSAEAVMAPYENVSSATDPKRCQFLMVKYEDEKRALKALNHFLNTYLPEYRQGDTVNSTNATPMLFELEDGWLGYNLIGNYVVIVFECPDQESVGTIIEKTESNLMKKGKDHEKK